MRLIFFALVCCWVTGCAGRSTCEVFSPPPAVGPTAQNDQRVAVLSTGDPTATGSQLGQQRCR
nr:hypothetical protein [Azomonas macrocytogenes]